MAPVAVAVTLLAMLPALVTAPAVTMAPAVLTVPTPRSLTAPTAVFALASGAESVAAYVRAGLAEVEAPQPIERTRRCVWRAPVPRGREGRLASVPTAADSGRPKDKKVKRTVIKSSFRHVNK